nr:caspase family protein [Micromonospora pattaloongensis]
MDCDSRQAQRAIEGFFSSARVTDGMNLLYLSCHGVQDSQGRLYFAFTDTERDFLSSTAVSADWVRERIYASRSKATLVVVDCCFSGVFIKGMRARSAGAASVQSLVRNLPQGSGVAVLTASGETEVSFEDADSAEVRPSYFTEALITGIATGAADLNRDGRVTVDELYDYVYEHVVSGPSPQRPRRLGMGEGVLVVSDVIRTPARQWSPVIPTAAVPQQPLLRTTGALVVRGVSGWVSFDGQWVVIGKDGVGNIYKGERRYHVSQMSGLAVKEATRLHHGCFQVLLAGVTPAPVARFGPNAGRPPMTDDNSVSFAKSANNDIRQLRDAVQQAIDVACGHAPALPTTAAAPLSITGSNPFLSTTRVRRGAGTQGPLAGPTAGAHRSPAGTDIGHNPASGPLGRTGGQHGHHEPVAADADTEYRRGEHDAIRAATRLPLAALDTLVGHQFDVVRWLRPWREHWRRALSEPGPLVPQVPPWLVDLAQHLGSHAAPAGSTNSTFTPTPGYLAGFCAGLRTTWNNAVTTRLVPADRPTIARWLAQSSSQRNLSMPLAEATLRDLETARQRAHRAAVIRWTLRGLMWAATGLLIFMEIAAIAITIDGSWTDANGKPATNQTSHAIIANVGCLIPLITLVAFLVFDVRRMRRTNATGAAVTEPAITAAGASHLPNAHPDDNPAPGESRQC